MKIFSQDLNETTTQKGVDRGREDARASLFPNEFYYFLGSSNIVEIFWGKNCEMLAKIFFRFLRLSVAKFSGRARGRGWRRGELRLVRDLSSF